VLLDSRALRLAGGFVGHMGGFVGRALPFEIGDARGLVRRAWRGEYQAAP